MVKIAINGLGRIGRCVLRAVFEENIQGIEIVAVNGPAEIEQHVHLLQYDSTHGRFPFPITHDGSNIIINGKKIPLLREKVASVYKRAHFAAGSHDIKILEDEISELKDEKKEEGEEGSDEDAPPSPPIDFRMKFPKFFRNLGLF
jgi:hypothetical protein